MIFLLALVGVLGVSASGPLVAATPSVPPLAMAFWRNGLGAGAMGVMATVQSRGRLRFPTHREWKYCLIAAVALALHFATFMTSVRLTTVAAATALVCLQSAWIAGFQRLRGAALGKQVGWGMALSLAGVVVITGFDVGDGSAEALLGDLLALVGGAFAGAYTLAGSKARATMDTGSYTTVCYALTAAMLLIMSVLMGEQLVGFPLAGWVGIIALTVASQLLGHTVFNHLVVALGPLVVSMIILLEIPGAAILAGIFLGQSPPVGTYLGLILILLGLLAVVWGQGRSLRHLPAVQDD
ncbi:MAG: DMT family transporter [Arthrobacter sp.]|uniref:DMT family transporter n=1 Tax=unclassified Arthrobacter TaxID=235627 RepID=UPI0026564C2D|nr:DMT family transporter [Micrococcaceae bacterium]MDN5811506.1 DMT family transporter [Micrococcaceae bacterium]MDN5825392.1 DMT family transporter [Micrococcaceae bacterium]MDN5878638.1 DMT family transporter [Micrococcaceae bacterium]MDN5886122.1 DMT family transporter [Micrococcaceae bacterium]